MFLVLLLVVGEFHFQALIANHGTVTCIGQWNGHRRDECCFQGESVRIIVKWTLHLSSLCSWPGTLRVRGSFSPCPWVRATGVARPNRHPPPQIRDGLVEHVRKNELVFVVLSPWSLRVVCSCCKPSLSWLTDPCFHWAVLAFEEHSSAFVLLFLWNKFPFNACWYVF